MLDMMDLQLFLGKNLTCFITSVGSLNIKSFYWPYTLFMSCSLIAVCSDSDGFRVASVHHSPLYTQEARTPCK